MKKKLFKNTNYNVGLVESYKASDQSHSGGPIIGSFSVKGMTVENMISQNRTKYSEEVWAQPTAFGVDGKFLDESGKLRPSTLFGSVDHPADDRAEILLNEAAICWYDVKRNPDGSWDGSADILNNPQGRIVKTLLDYAKERGGGNLLGVSSRALGESVLSESQDGQYEAIVPESFELMSFDFVYNPSFQTAVAHVNESAKAGKKRSLVESVKKLAEEDEEHAEVYEDFAKKLVKESKESNMEKIKFEGNAINNAKKEYALKLRDKEKELHDAIYEIEKLSDEEFEKKYDGKRETIYKKLTKEYKEVLAELENIKNPKVEEDTKSDEIEIVSEDTITTEEKEIIKEGVIEDAVDEGKEKALKGEEETDEDEEDADEETDEDEEDADEENTDTEEEIEEEEEDELSLIRQVKDLLIEIKEFIMPVEDPEALIGDDEIELGLEDEEETDEEDADTKEDVEGFDMSEEELDQLSDEDLEYMLKLEKESKKNK